MKNLFLSVLISVAIIFAAINSFAGSQRTDDYHGIKITEWSFYAAWGMSTMHHVTIENTSDMAYKDVRVKVSYYLSYYPTKPNVAMLVLPVTIPPHSKKTYLKEGMSSLIVNPDGMYGMHLIDGDIEVVGAIPITAEYDHKYSSANDKCSLKKANTI